MIKVGDKINLAYDGGVECTVIKSKQTTGCMRYVVVVNGTGEKLSVSEYNIAKYGVGQAVAFRSSPNEVHESEGKIIEIRYNEETNKVEYKIWHEVIERFSSLPTPVTTTVTEDCIVRTLPEYQPFKDIWMCD